MNNLRLAIRSFRATSMATTFAILLLSLGVATTVVLYAVADAAMFRPFPFIGPDRLIIAAEQRPNWPRAEVSHANFREWRRRTRTFDDLAAMGSSNWTMVLRGTDSSVAVPYRAVSGNFFTVLGVRAAFGRTFGPTDDQRGAARVAVISDGFWRRQFGGDRSAIGRSITLSEHSFTIVGIMPRDFTYPAGADVWAPLVPELASIHRPGLPDFVDGREAAVLYVIGRLKPGVTLTVARDDLDRVIGEVGAVDGETERVTGLVTPLVDDLLGSVKVSLWAMLSAVGLLLLATIANVGGLLLVQLANRRRELTIRLALGASTTDLMRPLLWECSLLVALATICALFIARGALGPVQMLLAQGVPRLDEATIGLRVVVFTIVLAVVTVSACWLAPALSLGRGHLEAGLRPSSRVVASGGFARSGRRWLVAIEVAIAVVILAGAGLLYRSVGRLNRLDLGFEARHLLAVEVGLPEPLASSDDRAAVHQFYDRMFDTVRALPFVRSAAAVGERPLKGPIGLDSSWQIAGQSEEVAKQNPWVNLEPITPAYFATLGTRVLYGRVFTDQDQLSTEPVVVVNEKLANFAWPGQSAVGKRIRGASWFGLDNGPSPPPWFTVVGVVANIRDREVGASRLDVYVPFAQSRFGVTDLMIRTIAAPEVAVSAIRTRLQTVNPNGLIDVVPMDRVVTAEEAPWHEDLLPFGMFAALTSLLAAAGLYALLAASTAEHTREIGIRTALGASAARIIKDALGQGLRTVAPGVVIGLVLVASLGRFIRTLLFEVGPLDVSTLVATVLVLLTISVIACVRPAFLAARVDPAVCLRAE